MANALKPTLNGRFSPLFMNKRLIYEQSNFFSTEILDKPVIHYTFVT